MSCSLNHLRLSNQFDTPFHASFLKGRNRPQSIHIIDTFLTNCQAGCILFAGSVLFLFFFYSYLYQRRVRHAREQRCHKRLHTFLPGQVCLSSCLPSSHSPPLTLLSPSLFLSVWQSRSTVYGFYLFVLLSMRTLVKCKPLSPLQLGLRITTKRCRASDVHF